MPAACTPLSFLQGSDKTYRSMLHVKLQLVLVLMLATLCLVAVGHGGGRQQ